MKLNFIKSFIYSKELVLSIFLGISIGFITQYALKDMYYRNFMYEKNEILHSIQLNLKFYEHSAKSIREVYQQNKIALKENEFTKISQNLTSNLTSSIGVGFYRYVPIENISQFEHFMTKEMQINNLSEFSFKINSEQILQKNVIVQNAYPLEDFSNAIGRNILKLPSRQETLDYAIKNDLAITPVLTLIANKSKKAILFFMPIWNADAEKSHNSNETSYRNYENLYGFISVGFDAKIFFSDLIRKNSMDQSIDFSISDITVNSNDLKNITKKEIFFETKPIVLNDNLLYQQEFFNYAGRTWLLEFQENNNFIAHPIMNLLPYMSGLIIFIISFLISLNIRLQKENLLKSNLLQIAEKTCSKEKEYFKKIKHNLPVPFFIINSKYHNIIYYNHQAVDLFALSKNPEEFNNLFLDFKTFKRFIKQLEASHYITNDFEVLLKKENDYHFWGIIATKPIIYDEQMFLLVTVLDISHRKQIKENLQALANLDHLTGLNNRRTFFELANQEFNYALENKIELCCLIINVDNFNELNDKHGCVVGDKAIQFLALHCLTFLPKPNIIGRLDGEDFGVILSKTDLKSALSIADNFRERISLQEFEVSMLGIKCSFTISIGVSTLKCNSCETRAYCFENDQNLQHQSIEDLMLLAKKALARAKEKGKNQVSS